MLDLAPLKALVAKATAPVSALQIPKAPEQKAPQGVDMSSFLASMQAQGPVDHRLQGKAAGDDRLRHGITAALQAAAASGGGIGDMLLGGAAGLFGGFQASDDEQKAETKDWEQEQRAFSAQMSALQLQAEEQKIALANATSETEHENALSAYNTTLAQLQENQASQREANSLATQQLGLQLDLAQTDVEQRNQASEINYRNAESTRQYQKDLLELNSPKILGMSDDGQIVTMQERDPATGKLTITQKSSGPLGAARQMTQMISALGLPPEATKQFHYSQLAKFGPEYLKREVIKDILKGPNSDLVFDPDQQKTLLGGGFGDAFTTSDYERAYQEAEKATDAMMKKYAAAGVPPPAGAEDAFFDNLALLLEPQFSAAQKKRALGLKDPALTYALGLIQ